MSWEEEARSLIRELAETCHQTGSIRDHVDRDAKTWTVGTIEQCDDSLCLDALALLARGEGGRGATPPPDPVPRRMGFYPEA